MTTTPAPQLALTRTFSAPRSLVYQAFTDPDQVARWWGPTGDHILREEMEFDVRPGGHERWTETFPADPERRVQIQFDLTEVIPDELLEGTMRVSGKLPGDFEPFETRMRIEFHEEPDGRTRLEIRQWLAEHLISPSENGWDESFAKLEAVLAA